jgi:hypothetical protein
MGQDLIVINRSWLNPRKKEEKRDVLFHLIISGFSFIFHISTGRIDKEKRTSPSTFMSIAFYIALFTVIAVPFLLLYWLIRSKGRKIVEKFEALYGESLLLVTGCGIITGLNRVPGVLALLHDRIIYESAIISKSGEILFQDIVRITMEDTRRTRHRRARKYRNAKVLEIITTEGTINLFAIPFSKAREWERALYDNIKDRPYA